jgi:hypothetical protein
VWQDPQAINKSVGFQRFSFVSGELGIKNSLEEMVFKQITISLKSIHERSFSNPFMAVALQPVTA